MRLRHVGYESWPQIFDSEGRKMSVVLEGVLNIAAIPRTEVKPALTKHM